MKKLYYSTVTPLLLDVLQTLMKATEFDEFRLVGGTALSLHLGHRQSIDIDLFTASEYGTIDFQKIGTYLRKTFPYVDTDNLNLIGIGKCFFVGENKDNSIKLDVFYSDKFIDEIQIIDNIRLASVEEIIAMKLDVIQRGGRKKDFWDLHELLDDYNLTKMLNLHEIRYPYSHDKDLIVTNFTHFTSADDDFDPICLRGKHWELIKLDLNEFVKHTFK
jgi:Nucleotidyl transferase AbiEii toxin, Type IV TA system